MLSTDTDIANMSTNFAELKAPCFAKGRQVFWGVLMGSWRFH